MRFVSGNEWEKGKWNIPHLHIARSVCLIVE